MRNGLPRAPGVQRMARDLALRALGEGVRVEIESVRLRWRVPSR